MLQDNFDGDPATSFTIRSSNFCSVRKRNGLSCTAEYGPCQGLGKAIFSPDYIIYITLFKDFLNAQIRQN